MSVWLTPERKPFFGGSYFPARNGDRGSSTGFLTLLKQIRTTYDEQPDKVSESGKQLTEIVGRMLKPNSGNAIPEAKILHQANGSYKKGFDSNFGGLTGAPKFPSSLPIRHLLRYYRRTGDKDVLKMATLTLEKMSAGGMYDQVGGGFHRYSTDSKWLVPHFEKMLYDNALLTMAYLEAYQVTGNKEFLRVTENTLRYVKRDMTSPEGAFYSATDADSLNPRGHREEGWFFTWTPDEIDQVLGKENAKLLKAYYDVTSHGNFEGRNILNSPIPLSQVAKKFNQSSDNALKTIETGLEKLYQVRLTRPPPIRDEKIITAWNGLMISAYAKAGFALNNNEYVTAAVRAAEFILKHLYKSERLFRSYKDGKAKFNAYLDDYSFCISALLDLYEATSELKWLKHAIALDKTLENNFEDKNAGGFFMTSHDHEELLAREKPANDGAEPSGNSVAILNLLRLSEFTTEDSYRNRAERALKSFSEILQSSPTALSEMLLAVDFHLDKTKEIVIVTPKGKRQDSEVLLTQFRKQFLPNRILAVLEEGDEIQTHSKFIPLVKAKIAQSSKATAYVCEKGYCELPTSDPIVFLRQISKIQKFEGN